MDTHPPTDDPRLVEPKKEAPSRQDKSPKIVIPEYQYSIEGSGVTFGQIVRAHHRSRSGDAGDALVQSHAWYYPKLLNKFKEINGAVEELYFSKNIEGGAAVTDRMKDPWELPNDRWRWGVRKKNKCRGEEQRIAIHVRYPPENVAAVTPRFQQALWRCIALSRMGDQLLRPGSARVIVRRTYSILVNLLSVLDAQPHVKKDDAEATERIEEAIRDADAELVEARKQYVTAAHWDSQFAYCKGMLYGLVILAFVLAILVGVNLFARPPDLLFLAVCWGAGGIGAIVSVMARLTSDKFKINYEAEHGSLRLLGIFRPLIGAIFGTALFVLISGGLLSVPVPRESELQALYFFVGVAFLAGFSERLAPDAFVESAKITEPPVQQSAPAGALSLERISSDHAEATRI